MDREDIMVREMSQRKTILYGITYMWNLQNAKLAKAESKLVVTGS